MYLVSLLFVSVYVWGHSLMRWNSLWIINLCEEKKISQVDKIIKDTNYVTISDNFKLVIICTIQI